MCFQFTPPAGVQNVQKFPRSESDRRVPKIRLNNEVLPHAAYPDSLAREARVAGRDPALDVGRAEVGLPAESSSVCRFLVGECPKRRWEKSSVSRAMMPNGHRPKRPPSLRSKPQTCESDPVVHALPNRNINGLGLHLYERESTLMRRKVHTRSAVIYKSAVEELYKCTNLCGFKLVQPARKLHPPGGYLAWQMLPDIARRRSSCVIFFNVDHY